MILTIIPLIFHKIPLIFHNEKEKFMKFIIYQGKIYHYEISFSFNSKHHFNFARSNFNY